MMIVGSPEQTEATLLAGKTAARPVRVQETHDRWLYEQAVQHAFRLDPDILVRPRR